MNKTGTVLFLTIFLACMTAFMPVKNFRTHDRSSSACATFMQVPGSTLHAAETAATLPSENEDRSVPGSGDSGISAMLPVMAVVLVIWFGIAFFLFRLDRRVNSLEQELHEE